ncbi:C/H/G cyclin [Conidiobolus coronatus NRRL 28638]|uniref:C/H/G cyclin n=1 Tax=Conidiobolus coronatus (strain ATCC 28846 / CBS 209.66 / NRRL 28638) TaxID=796925 RepID=A0A137PG58_CONC2|nr:C/H/G cyclin [Conidiobolus coronatus NRRL 28638]|eukprot:KXN73987.1 C/H/G cyclin [Conidiobolus coronatus NRRL 28638]
MSCNYWESSQYKYWLFKNLKNSKSYQEDLELISVQDLNLIHIYFAEWKRLRLRQKIIASATTYFKRFYYRNSFRFTEPFLVATTSMYIACKVEEFPHHITTVVNESMHVLLDSSPSFRLPYDACDVCEFELILLEELNCNTLIHHPYHPLQKYLVELNLSLEQKKTAWYITNDTYKTPLILLHAPHMIALAALMMSCQYHHQEDVKSSPLNRPNNNDEDQGIEFNEEFEFDKVDQPQVVEEAFSIENWFSNLNVDLEEIADIIQQIIHMYFIWTNKYQDSKALTLLRKLHTGLP